MKVSYSSRMQADIWLSSYIKNYPDDDLDHPGEIAEKYLDDINDSGISVFQKTAADIYAYTGMQSAAGYPLRRIPLKDRSRRKGLAMESNPFIPADAILKKKQQEKARKESGGEITAKEGKNVKKESAYT